LIFLKLLQFSQRTQVLHYLDTESCCQFSLQIRPNTVYTVQFSVWALKNWHALQLQSNYCPESKTTLVSITTVHQLYRVAQKVSCSLLLHNFVYHKPTSIIFAHIRYRKFVTEG